MKPIRDDLWDWTSIFASDLRIAYIRVNDDGFVANAYDWPAPGVGRIIYRNLQVVPFRYDRKRSYGRGPSWVAFSEHDGRLKSW